MAPAAHDFDLGGLRLSAGEGRRLELEAPIEPLVLGSERYVAEPARVPVELTISRMIGGGYALRLRFSAAISGPCMRCLRDASPSVEVDAREVDRPGGGEELDSPYVHGDDARPARAGRATPSRSRCRPRSSAARTAPGCARCARADLAEAGPDHHHESAPDPRWAKLRELKLE